RRSGHRQKISRPAEARGSLVLGGFRGGSSQEKRAAQEATAIAAAPEACCRAQERAGLEECQAARAGQRVDAIDVGESSPPNRFWGSLCQRRSIARAKRKSRPRQTRGPLAIGRHRQA